MAALGLLFIAESTFSRISGTIHKVQCSVGSVAGSGVEIVFEQDELKKNIHYSSTQARNFLTQASLHKKKTTLVCGPSMLNMHHYIL